MENNNKLENIYGYIEFVVPIIRTNIQSINNSGRKYKAKEKYLFSLAARCLASDAILNIDEMINVYNNIYKNDQFNPDNDKFRDFVRIRNNNVPIQKIRANIDPIRVQGSGFFIPISLDGSTKA